MGRVPGDALDVDGETTVVDQLARTVAALSRPQR